VEDDAKAKEQRTQVERSVEKNLRVVNTSPQIEEKKEKKVEVKCGCVTLL
jgi:hypothetical protein